MVTLRVDPEPIITNWQDALELVRARLQKALQDHCQPLGVEAYLQLLEALAADVAKRLRDLKEVKDELLAEEYAEIAREIEDDEICAELRAEEDAEIARDIANEEMLAELRAEEEEEMRREIEAEEELG